jgi:hypothetical protein
MNPGIKSMLVFSVHCVAPYGYSKLSSSAGTELQGPLKYELDCFTPAVRY